MDHKIIKQDKEFEEWRSKCSKVWQVIMPTIGLYYVWDPSLKDAYNTYKSGVSPEKCIADWLGNIIRDHG